MIERIGPAERSVAGTIRMPRAKRSTGMDLSYRLRIRQVGIEVHRGAGSDSCHLQALDIEFQRQLARSQSINDQLCSIADQLVHNDFYLAPLGRHVLHLSALLPGRQIQLHSLYEYSVDIDGRVKKIADSHMEAELGNANDRLKSGLVIIRIGFSENSETGARDLESLAQRDVESIELNLTLEPGRQGLNHRCAQDRFGAVDHDAQYCHRQQAEERNSGDPS